MRSADIEPLANKEVAHHPSARKREFEMQFVDPQHQSQISSRNRARQVIDAAPANAEGCGLLLER